MKKSILLATFFATFFAMATNNGVIEDKALVVKTASPNKTVRYEIQVWVNSELVFKDKGCAYLSWLDAEKEYLQNKYNTTSVYITVEHSPYDCALQ